MCRARRSPARRGKSPAEPAPIQPAALDQPEQQESDGEDCESLVFSEEESVNVGEEEQPAPPPAAQPPAAGKGRGGGSKPLFMGIDVQLLSYFAFWSVPIPEAARTYPLPTPQPGHITTLGATQVPAQLLLLD